MPRHEDELELEVDDPLLVELQAEDYWYEAYNMRTGARGIFPAYYAIEVTKEPEHMAGSVPFPLPGATRPRIFPAPACCQVKQCSRSQAPREGAQLRWPWVSFTIDYQEAPPGWGIREWWHPLLALPLMSCLLSSPDQKQRLGGPVSSEVPGLSPGSLPQRQ